MPKESYEVSIQEEDIMENLAARHPVLFPGFDRDQIKVVRLREKGNSDVVKVTPTKFPNSLWMGWAYTFVIFEDSWMKLDETQQNLILFNAMCCIPEGGYDTESGNYAKVVKPKHGYTHEWTFEICGGRLNWMEPGIDMQHAKDPIRNFSIPDPMDEDEDDEDTDTIFVGSRPVPPLEEVDAD